jgi:hypothetical protein
MRATIADRGVNSGESGIMLHWGRLAAAVCLLAFAGLLCASATPSMAARHHSSAVAKKGSIGTKHAARHRSGRHKGKKTDEAKVEAVGPEPRTPTDKAECISVSQAYYKRAQSVGGRGRHGVPKEFERVVSNLDQFCGEEEFDKARVSIDWMDNCLKNFDKDAELGFCSRSKSYFCAIDAASQACRTSTEAEASGRASRE